MHYAAGCLTVFTSLTNSFFCPALGLAFVPLGYEGLKVDAIKFEFNMYTGPGYLSALLGVINIILLIVVFRGYKLTRHRQMEKMAEPVDCCNSASSSQKMTRLLTGELVVKAVL